MAAELRPDDARVEGVGGDAAAEQPLAQLLGEEDVGKLQNLSIRGNMKIFDNSFIIK